MVPVRFIHISDTHIGPTTTYAFAGVETYGNALQVVGAINALPFMPDFVIHTGDVVCNPDEGAYRLAGELFAQLKVPAYFVTGNHDSSKMINSYLRQGPRSEQGVADSVSYAFERNGIRFLTLDARGPDSIDPHGLLPGHQFEFLRTQLQSNAMPAVVFIHFPPFSLDAPWFDREMLLLNGEELHGELSRFRERARGVFLGHLHRGIQLVRDGIFYSSVASTCYQFKAWPRDEEVRIGQDPAPAFNLVTVFQDNVIVKEYTLHSLPDT